MELKLADATSSIEVADEVFARDFNEGLIHQTVTAYLAGARAGTKAHKSRADVRGGGAKPWRQKGSGRARVGSSRNPIWRGGGVTFAARPRNHEQKLNKKMYRGAMRSILSELNRQERLLVVKEFDVETHKTRELVKKLAGHSLDSVLIVSHQAGKNLYLAARNLHTVDVLEVGGLDPVSLLRYDKVLVTAEAVKLIEGWLGS